MKTIVQVRVTVDGETEEAAGFDVGVAGLAAVKDWTRDGRWLAVHCRSGLTIGLFADPESAAAFIIEIAHLADWTQSGADLADAFPSFMDEHLDTLRRVGGWRSGNYRGNPSDIGAAS